MKIFKKGKNTTKFKHEYLISYTYGYGNRGVGFLELKTVENISWGDIMKVRDDVKKTVNDEEVFILNVVELRLV